MRTELLARLVGRFGPGSGRALARPSLAALIAVGLLVVFGLQPWESGHVRYDTLRMGITDERANQSDFFQFWAVGAATLHETDIYSPAARAALGQSFQAAAASPSASARQKTDASRFPVAQDLGSPLLYALFGYLQSGDFELDSTVFEAVSLACVIGALFWLCRRLRYGPALSLLAVAAIVGTSEPLVMDLGWGNVNSIQVAMLVGYLALRWGAVTPRRSIAAGALLGFAILTKPNLALIVPLLGVELLLARRYRDMSLQVAGLAAGALVGVLISAVRFGSVEPWFGWIDALRTLTPNYIWRENSVPAIILSLTGGGDSGAATLLSAVMMASLSVLAAVVLARAYRGPTHRLDNGDPDPDSGTWAEEDRWRREVLVMGLAVAITLLGAPFAWNHYFLLLTPLLVYLLRPTQAGDLLGGPIRGRHIAAIAAFVLFSAEPAKILAAPGDTVPYFVCLAIGTVILLAAALWELARPAPRALRYGTRWIARSRGSS